MVMEFAEAQAGTTGTDSILNMILAELEEMNETPMSINIDGSNVFKAVRRQANMYKKQTGQTGLLF